MEIGESKSLVEHPEYARIFAHMSHIVGASTSGTTVTVDGEGCESTKVRVPYTSIINAGTGEGGTPTYCLSEMDATLAFFTALEEYVQHAKIVVWRVRPTIERGESGYAARARLFVIR
jgi:hypothetical protein